MQSSKVSRQQKWTTDLRSSISNDSRMKRNFVMTRSDKGINFKAKLAQSHKQLKESEFRPKVLVSKKATRRVQTVRSHNQLYRDPSLKLTS